MPHDPSLTDLMRAALAGRPGVSGRTMFGGGGGRLNGNLLCGVEVGRSLFRVGPVLRADAGLENPIHCVSRFVAGVPPK